jgi:hypothetical protein
MDFEAIARERRREQAHEALEFERERERALREQLEAVVTELEGPRIDEAAFATMSPEDVQVVRDTLGSMLDEPGDDESWLGDEPEADEWEESEAEISRLEQEIAGSRRRQGAFERYLGALGE